MSVASAQLLPEKKKKKKKSLRKVTFFVERLERFVVNEHVESTNCCDFDHQSIRQIENRIYKTKTW